MKYLRCLGLIGILVCLLIPSESKAYNIKIVDIPCPEWQQELYGCYKLRGDEIQIKRGLDEETKKFVLYHEIGHLYTWGRMYQFREISDNREFIADYFAFWVMGYVPPVNPGIWQEKFSQVCNKECLLGIKSIKI